MKKICFFLPTLNFGGIEANTIRLAKSFVDIGYTVDLVTGSINGDYLDRIDTRINVISLNKKTLISMLIPLVKYIKEKNPMVVITGGEGANILLCTAKLVLRKIKIIISIRTNLTNEYKETISMKKKILFPFISKRLYKKADNIIAVSQGVANDASNLLKIPLNSIRVIYNPILDDNLLELKNKNIQHKWLDDKDIQVIISVGRLVKQKDFPTLIRSFKLVREQNKNVKLLILGDGPEREKIKSEIKKNNLTSDIEIVGFVQNPYAYINKADLFVLSSKWEGFGNVLVEALATGIPTVSIDCPNGPSEILGEGRYGRLIEPGNVNKLAQGIIEELINGTSNVEDRVKRASDFSVEIAREKYKELINE